jgi:transcription elongation factor Elf1
VKEHEDWDKATEPKKLFDFPKCPKCGSESSRHEVRNYDMMWHDGDVYCKDCGTYVRGYDAG